MCGIIGYFGGKSIPRNLFNKARDSLLHRGPNWGESVFFNNDQHAIGHRRLSIIDLSNNANQPISNEDETIWVTYNGEIYNFIHLKSELIKCGHIFKSSSDTEVIVHGYEEWGIDGLLNKIEGMFAFGIYDEKNQIVTLARDHFGIKPLYYSLKNGFTFASEIKGILPLINNVSIDKSAILDYLVIRYIPSPKSIYSEVRKVKPGNFLTYNLLNGSLDEKRYWELKSGNVSDKNNSFIESLSFKLLDSVKQNLISDVPVGLFLSGGYDSSLLAFLLKESQFRTKTFSIGFDNWEKSEHIAARLVSKVLNTDHVEKILPQEISDLSTDLSFFYDEPLGGGSFFPTYMLSKLASNSVKVALSGDGGDELVAGYNWHKQIYDVYKSNIFRNLIKNRKKLSRLYFNSMNWTGLSYIEANKLLSTPLPTSSLPDDCWLFNNFNNFSDDPIKQLQYFDFMTFLPDLILTKIDRASMACSLEVRVPFLNHKIFDFVFKYHSSVYFKNNTYKYSFKEIMKGFLPHEIIQKPKQGFSAPLQNFNTDSCLRSIKQNPSLKEIIDIKKVNFKIKKNIYVMSILNNWIKRWSP